MLEIPQGARAVDRALRLLLTMVESRGEQSLADAAADLNLPLSTANRLAATLEAHGLLARTSRGRYQGGMALARCAAQLDPVDLLARVARPVLRALAARTGRTAHLGILENGMVTYLVRESPAGESLFTREAMQLEAYCSGIGKVLLAALPEHQRSAYIDEGAFVALTARTIVDPEALREHLKEVAKARYAVDDEEIDEGLFCLAVPLATPCWLPEAALSLAGLPCGSTERAGLLAAAQSSASAIGRLIEHAGAGSLPTRAGPT